MKVLDINSNSLDLTLIPADNSRLANLCGQLNSHLQQIEKRLGIEISNRGNRFRLKGSREAIKIASVLLEKLFANTEVEVLTPEYIHLSLQDSHVKSLLDGEDVSHQSAITIKPDAVLLRGAVRINSST